MVSSGSFSTKGWYSSTYGDYVYLEFAWSVQSTSIANNSTTIYWELRGKRTTNHYTKAGGFKVVIDGSTEYSQSTDYRIELRNGTIVAYGTYTFTHDGAGKRTFSAYAEGGINTYAVNSTGSGSWELPTIPRQATLTSAPDFTDEQNPTITYSNPAGSAVTELKACISFDGSKDDIAYRDIPVGGSTYTFNLTDAERAVLRNATATSNSRAVIFYVRTKIGGTDFYSTITKTLSIVNANPTYSASSVTYADINATVVGITGNNQHIVQNKSNLNVTIGGAAGNKGAWITQYSVSVNGVSKTASASGSFAFGAVNASQNTNIQVVVKDSRGNTTTVSKTVTVLPYSSPVVNASLSRLNNYEDETYLTPKVSISSVNNKNSLAVWYNVKVYGGSYGNDIKIENNKTVTTTCDKNYSYVFAITVADAFESLTREFVLDKGKFPFFIDTDKNAVGINAFPDVGQALAVAGGIGNFVDGVCSNGVYIKSVRVDAVDSFAIATSFAPSFTAEGVNLRQAIFMFGWSNGVIISGVIGVNGAGGCIWSGTSGVTVTPNSNGTINVGLPYTSWDNFALISPNVFWV